MHQIKLRLHWWATIPQREASSFFLFVALTHKSQSFATRMVRVDGADAPTEVTFADKITFEGVAPGFEIEGQVYCYTYVDPHRAEALRRVSTPKKAMERAAKAARHIRSATPKKLKRLKQFVTSKLHGQESRQGTPERACVSGSGAGSKPATPRSRSGLHGKDFARVATFALGQQVLGDHNIDLELVDEENHPVGNIALMSSRISPVITSDMEDYLTFKTKQGWERFWTELKQGIVYRFTQSRPRQLVVRGWQRCEGGSGEEGRGKREEGAS